MVIMEIIFSILATIGLLVILKIITGVIKSVREEKKRREEFKRNQLIGDIANEIYWKIRRTENE